MLDMGFDEEVCTYVCTYARRLFLVKGFDCCGRLFFLVKRGFDGQVGRFDAGKLASQCWFGTYNI